MLTVRKKCWHRLADNKGQESIRHILFYDTEADSVSLTENLVELEFRLAAGIYIRLDPDGKVESEKSFIAETVEDFWNQVFSFVHDKEKLWVIAYNADHDFRQVKGFGTLFGQGWELDRLIVDSSRFIMKWRKEKKTLQFIDLGNYFGRCGLKQIGQMVGHEKLEVDFSNVSDKDLAVYCMRDVEIVKLAFLKLYRWFHSEQLGNFAMTLAGLSFNAFRHKFMKHQILIHAHPEAIELERKSYRGGRCECFYIGKIENEPLYKLDVVSMYASVMRENEFPVKLVKFVKPASLQGLIRALERFSVIAEVKVELHEPAIAVKQDKLLFPVGTFWATLTTPELKYVLQNGKILAVESYAIYESAPIFREFVEYFYGKRKEAAEKKDYLSSWFYKTVMNSLYGKFGQANPEWEELKEESPLEYGYFVMRNLRTHRTESIKVINHKQYRLVGVKEAFDAFPAIAAHVTAYARMKLWQFMKAAKGRKFYCDTDSLIVDEEACQSLWNQRLIGNNLGQLKIEARADSAEFKLPKVYRFGSDLHVKGFRNENRSMAFQGDTVKEEQWYRTPTLIHKGFLDRVLIMFQPKRINQNYDKGVVTSDGWVEPIELDQSVTELTNEEMAEIRRSKSRANEEEYKAWKRSEYYDRLVEDDQLTWHEKLEEFRRRRSSA